jgi:hypothetical protein
LREQPRRIKRVLAVSATTKRCDLNIVKDEEAE